MKKRDCVVGLKVKMIKRSVCGRRTYLTNSATGTIIKIYDKFALVRVYTREAK